MNALRPNRADAARRKRRLALAALMTVAGCAGRSAAPVPAGQNPSPMVESTRAHERLSPDSLDGTTLEVAGPAGSTVSVFVPHRATSSASADLVMHFHGAAWLPHQAAAALDAPAVIAVVNAGAGSSSYDRAFDDPAVFDSLLARVASAVRREAGVALGLDRMVLSAFSAGHGAVRAILRHAPHASNVHAVLLLDGLHTAYVPPRTVLSEGGSLNETNLTVFADFARAAVRGDRRFVITHSTIFPGTFASTTETADWLLAELGLARTPILRWGPRGVQQLSHVRAGGLEVLGFAGNSAPDHVDHLHALPEMLARVLAPPPD